MYGSTRVTSGLTFVGRSRFATFVSVLRDETLRSVGSRSVLGAPAEDVSAFCLLVFALASGDAESGAAPALPADARQEVLESIAFLARRIGTGPASTGRAFDRWMLLAQESFAE